MKDPYLYSYTDILKNLADIRDRETLSCMEAEYTSYTASGTCDRRIRQPF